MKHGGVLRPVRGGQKPRHRHGFIPRAAGVSQGGLAGFGLHRPGGVALPISQKRLVLGPSTPHGVIPIIRDDSRKAIGFVRGFIAPTRGFLRSAIGHKGASRHPKARGAADRRVGEGRREVGSRI